MIVSKIKILLVLAFLLFLSASGQAREKAGVVKIINGDNLVVKYKGKEQRVKFIGMDPPETRYNWKIKSDMKKSGQDLKTLISLGKEASGFLRTLIKKGDRVGLEFDAQKIQPAKDDKPVRFLAYVYLPDGRMLNEEIVRAGYG